MTETKTRSNLHKALFKPNSPDSIHKLIKLYNGATIVALVATCVELASHGLSALCASGLAAAAMFTALVNDSKHKLTIIKLNALIDAELNKQKETDD